jgi:hypothetical protein
MHVNARHTGAHGLWGRVGGGTSAVGGPLKLGLSGMHICRCSSLRVSNFGSTAGALESTRSRGHAPLIFKCKDLLQPKLWP